MMPPSTLNDWPVTFLASSDARHGHVGDVVRSVGPRALVEAIAVKLIERAVASRTLDAFRSFDRLWLERSLIQKLRDGPSVGK